MPLIKKRPSFNHEVIKGMTKQELLDMHPDADEEYVVSEWEKAKGSKASIDDVVSDVDLDAAVKKAKAKNTGV